MKTKNERLTADSIKVIPMIDRSIRQIEVLSLNNNNTQEESKQSGRKIL